MTCRNPFALLSLAEIETLKDRTHERLLWLCEEDPQTGCWIYTGPWQGGTGLGVLRVAGRQWTVHRVAAWVYLGGFCLADRTVKVRSCRCAAACFNPDHLAVEQSGAARLLRAA